MGLAGRSMLWLWHPSPLEEDRRGHGHECEVLDWDKYPRGGKPRSSLPSGRRLDKQEAQLLSVFVIPSPLHQSSSPSIDSRVPMLDPCSNMSWQAMILIKK